MNATRRQSQDPANRTKTGTAGDGLGYPWDTRRENGGAAAAVRIVGAAADSVGAVVGGERTRTTKKDVLGICPTSEDQGVLEKGTSCGGLLLSRPSFCFLVNYKRSLKENKDEIKMRKGVCGGGRWC